MFRFSVESGVRLDASAGKLASHAITEDKDWANRLKDTGEYREGEEYYRVENESPKTVEEAVAFVQGIVFHTPSRVWIGGEGHEITESIAANVRKPVAPGETPGRTSR